MYLNLEERLKTFKDKPSDVALSFASAGFYVSKKRRTVGHLNCIMCPISWKCEDKDCNPHKKHYEMAPKCAWVLCVCIPALNLEDYTLNELIKARESTFMNLWPHPPKRGFQPTVKKLSAAGFHYEPDQHSKDRVKCSYCGLFLKDWVSMDVPHDEHKRRSPNCRFFELRQQPMKRKRQKKTDNVFDIPDDVKQTPSLILRKRVVKKPKLVSSDLSSVSTPVFYQNVEKVTVYLNIQHKIPTEFKIILEAIEDVKPVRETTIRQLMKDWIKQRKLFFESNAKNRLESLKVY